MSNKKKIIIIAVIVAVSVFALAVSLLKKDNGVASPSKTNNAVQTEDIKAKFMYYVSEANENKEEALKIVDELKNEYKDEVDFVVINIDTEPEKVYGFALPDETPKLVLIGINNEFSMKSNCADKEVLKQEIENVINKK